jgi:oligoribonuclease (3'-5' exoribonuclease)
VPNLAWLDLETTGLHEQTDNVLEVGCIITSPALEIIAVENWIFHFDVTKTPPPKINDHVMEMHRVNGLWRDCANSKRGATHDDRAKLWKEVEAFIAQNGAQGSWLWGSGVGFERAWLRHSAPEVLSLFHYRNGDVNTLFGLQGLVFEGDPNASKAQPADQTHRALDDLERDIGIAKEWVGLLPRLAELEADLERFVGKK